MPFSPSTLPPGPSSFQIVQALRFGADPIGFMIDCQERYGDCFTIRMPGGGPIIACSHPEDVRRIFALKADDYCAADIAMPTPMGPGSLLFLDGDAHLKDRKLIVPMLLGDRLSAYGEVMTQTTDEVVSSWVKGRNFVLHPEMRSISMSIIVKCVFGIRDKQRLEHLCKLLTDWLEMALSPALFMVGLILPAATVRGVLDRASMRSLQRFSGHAPSWRRLPWQRLIDTKAELMSILFQEIRSCRQAGDKDRQDVLALMVAARYDDGSAPTDERIVDQLITMLVGGHETTANVLCWALRYMLPRPDVMAKVSAELTAAFPSGEFTVAGLRRLPYLEACIEESMRLLPVAVAIGRSLKKELTLQRCTAPVGTTVWACLHLTQRRPELWPAASEFQPERFLPNASHKENPGLGCPRESSYPFGGGRRRCVGMPFANYELRAVLARLLFRTSLSLSPDHEPKPVLRGVSFTPGESLQVRMN